MDSVFPSSPRLTGRACPRPPVLRFGSRSLPLHLVRGALGIPALLFGLFGYLSFGWPVLLLLPVGVFLLKGCPTCWLAGLFETLEYRAAVGASRPGRKK